MVIARDMGFKWPRGKQNSKLRPRHAHVCGRWWHFGLPIAFNRIQQKVNIVSLVFQERSGLKHTVAITVILRVRGTWGEDERLTLIQGAVHSRSGSSASCKARCMSASRARHCR